VNAASSIVPATKAPSALLSKDTPEVADVLAEFYSRRSKATLAAYKQDMARLRAFLELETDAAAAQAILSMGPGRANALLLKWRSTMEAAGLAPFTINRRLTAVRSLVKLARTLGVVNWALDVQGVKGASVIRDTRGPELVDVRKILAARHGFMEDAVLRLMFLRGLRSIEVRELEMKHVEGLEARGSILIRGKGKAGLMPVTLPDDAKRALLKWLEVRGDAPGFVFVQDDALEDLSKPMNHPFLWRLVKKAGARVGVKLWPHALRHSAVTMALDALDGDVRKVQKFSRHADVKTLLTHYDDERRDVGGEVAGEVERAVGLARDQKT
jgi:integrase/recombinase XerC